MREDAIWYRDDGYPHYLCAVVGCRTMIMFPKRICSKHYPRLYGYWQYKAWLVVHKVSNIIGYGHRPNWLWKIKYFIHHNIVGKIYDFFWQWAERRESKLIIHEKWLAAYRAGKLGP